MSGSSNFINDYAERKARTEDNERKVLVFLKREKVTTAIILNKLLSFKSKSGIYPLLKRLKDKKYIEEYKINDSIARNLSLYGITQLGVTMSLAENDDPFKIFGFSKSKINLSTLDHKLDIQEIYIIARNKSYHWKSTNNVKSKKGGKTPDALMRHNGVIYALEVERTPKSARRYKEIIELYLNQLASNEFNKILYLFPESNTKDRVFNIFKKVDSAIVQGNKIAINESIINKYFLFMTYEEFNIKGVDV